MRRVIWKVTTPPNNLNYFLPNLVGFRFLKRKNYSEIVFRDTVKIRVIVLNDGEYKTLMFELKPNTPVGSTLKYSLEQVYRKMYKLTDNDKLIDAKQIVISDIYHNISLYDFIGFRKKDAVYSCDIE